MITSNASRKQETAWSALADQVNQLNNDVAQLERLTSQIGGPRDSEKLRNDLRLLREGNQFLCIFQLPRLRWPCKIIIE